MAIERRDGGQTTSGIEPAMRSILSDFLGNQATCVALLRRDEETISQAQSRIRSLGQEKVPAFMGHLLRGLARNRDFTLRRGVREIVRLVPWDEIPPQNFQEEYLTAVDTLTERPNVDNIGPLLFIGREHAAHFPLRNRTRREIAQHWIQLAERFDNEDVWRFIAVGVFDIQQQIHPFGPLPSQDDTLRRRKILQECSSTVSINGLRKKLAQAEMDSSRKTVRTDILYLRRQGIPVLLDTGNKPLPAESEAINQTIQELSAPGVTLGQLQDSLRERGLPVSRDVIAHRAERLQVTRKRRKPPSKEFVEARRADLVDVSTQRSGEAPLTVREIVAALRAKDEKYQGVTDATVNNDIRILGQQGIRVEVTRNPIIPSRQVFPDPTDE